MSWRTSTFFIVFGFLGVCCVAQPTRRIRSAIKESETFRLSGNTKPTLSLMQDQGEVSTAKALPRITMHFAMTSAQREDLEQLLRQQQSPSSAQYHKFLTPDEWAARFGVNSEDIAQISAWLQNQGFTNIEVARSKNFVSFEGDAGQVQNAFHTSIHRFLNNGESHYANISDPLLPKALQGMVESVHGLTDFRKRPLNVRRLNPRFTSNISGNHFLAPDDFASIYDVKPIYQSGYDGTGVKIAIVGQSDVQLSDLRAFRTAASLPPNDPTIMVIGADPGIQSSDEVESDLDLEWSGAIAKNANIIFVTETNVEDSISYVIDNNLAPVLAISYGLCESQSGQAESNTQSTQFQQANAEGMTVVASAGDSGAADCDTNYPARDGLAVDLPASSPNVTGVGGTTFSEGSGTYWNTTNNGYGGSAISYIPEVIWNDSGSGSLDAGGGGKSIFFAKPSWQAGSGVPNDGARDVPDLSFAASPSHDGYLICSGGDCVNGFRNTDTTLDVIGGTSCGSPSFAGIVALLVQALGLQGNINPNLYSLASSSANAFHDVTSGSNAVPCRTNSPNCTSGTIGYSAGTGYDLASGWGSVDAYQLFTAWPNASGLQVGHSNGPLGYVPITPCRLVDTRNPVSAFGGGPEMSSNETREFSLPHGPCGIPASAAAYALNITVVPDNELGYLAVWPAGQSKPTVSTLNSEGRVKANAAIVAAGTNGGIEIYVSDPTQVVVDISGYFASTGTSQLQFFPLTPCRLVDTRFANGNLGSPYLTGGQSRTFPLLSSSCNVPASAQAYSLNFTAVPHQAIGAFSAWPAGLAAPGTSILNSSDGTVTANAAIVNAGTSGAITVNSSADTDLVIDINGYFALPATGGLSLYTLAPCRVIDTRNPGGSQPQSGASTINVVGSGCGSPATAQAFVLNATVVPDGPLYFLSLWPTGGSAPQVSTLNANPDEVTSNMAIVPTNNGSINAYAAGTTYLILDMSGYFAP